jgi:putative holliday junction resolvase
VKPAGAVLGFDFGSKRIGVAVGELSIAVAHPLLTIAAESNSRRFAAIAALVAEWNPVLLVVGVASHEHGGEHETGRLARRFAQRLQGRFEVATVLVDERLSSFAAAASLREAGVRGRAGKQHLDSMAAREILQTYFHSRANRFGESQRALP